MLLCGRLAQLVEHPPFKRTVMGSNPVAPTNNINDLATPRGGFFMSQRRLQRQIDRDRPILCAKKTVTVRLLADAILFSSYECDLVCCLIKVRH